MLQPSRNTLVHHYVRVEVRRREIDVVVEQVEVRLHAVAAESWHTPYLTRVVQFQEPL